MKQKALKIKNTSSPKKNYVNYLKKLKNKTIKTI